MSSKYIEYIEISNFWSLFIRAVIDRLEISISDSHCQFDSSGYRFDSCAYTRAVKCHFQNKTFFHMHESEINLFKDELNHVFFYQQRLMI